MSHRLSRIVTRRGDQGHTTLADGTQLIKSHPQIVALGSIDELNTHIALLHHSIQGHGIPDTALFNPTSLQTIQHHLFDLGAGLAFNPPQDIESSYWEALEAIAVELNQSLPALKEFILPGGSQTACYAHLCRSVCRRAESNLTAVEDYPPQAQRYLNRLSDYLFILARIYNQYFGHSELLWQKNANFQKNK